LSLAKKFNSSVADIISVCGAVATEFLGGPTIITYDRHHPFLVGRHDRDVPNPANSLAPANLNTTGFSQFAEKRNLTLEEMTALMGSHALLDEKGCLMNNGSMCNPHKSPCTDLKMFTWTNIYYKETCIPKIRINNPPALSTLPLPTKEFLMNQQMCKFTSVELREKTMGILTQEIVDPLGGVLDPKAVVGGPDTEFEDVTWFNQSTISKKWDYTIHDAWMGKACQNDIEKSITNDNIGEYMRKFRDYPNYWNKIYIRAYKKMINTGATWNKHGGMPIHGKECISGFVSDIHENCKLCHANEYGDLFKCPQSCRCKTSFNSTEIFYN